MVVEDEAGCIGVTAMTVDMEDMTLRRNEGIWNSGWTAEEEARGDTIAGTVIMNEVTGGTGGGGVGAAIAVTVVLMVRIDGVDATKVMTHTVTVTVGRARPLRAMSRGTRGGAGEAVGMVMAGRKRAGHRR